MGIIFCPYSASVKSYQYLNFHILETCLYVTRHDILCPNAVKRDVGKTRCKSDVIYATALCCAICLSPSYTVTIQAPIHHDSSRFETDGKIGVHRDASGWKKKKFQHQYDISRCSYGVCTIHLRIHYDL